MIYTFIGTDTEKVRAKVQAWTQLAQEKEPNLTYIRMTSDSFDERTLEEALEGQSLFAKKLLISLDGVLEETPLEEYFSRMAESKNVFVIIEAKIKKVAWEALEVLVTKSFTYNVREKGIPGNIFAIGDAFARKDLQAMWIAYHEARFRNDPPQQTFGILHAKIRKLLGEGSRHFSKEELATLSHKGIVSMQESRQGVWSTEYALEYFLLSIA